MIEYKCDDDRYYYLYLFRSKTDWNYDAPPFYYIGYSTQKSLQRIKEHFAPDSTNTAVTRFIKKNGLPPADECCDIVVRDVTNEFNGILESDRKFWIEGLEQYSKQNVYALFPEEQLKRLTGSSYIPDFTCESVKKFNVTTFAYLGKEFCDYYTGNRITMRQVETYTQFNNRLLGLSCLPTSTDENRYFTRKRRENLRNEFFEIAQMEHFLELCYAVMNREMTMEEATILWSVYHPDFNLTFDVLFKAYYKFFANDYGLIFKDKFELIMKEQYEKNA